MKRGIGLSFSKKSTTPKILSPSQVPPFSTQQSDVSERVEEVHEGRRERCKWSQTENIVLCSSWLNTSKDVVVGNEQKLNVFWTRIALYFNSSPKLADYPNREPRKCKARWHKINDFVCKFVGSFEAAKKQKTSGQNDDDVLKTTYEIFNNDHQIKFNLEHA